MNEERIGNWQDRRKAEPVDLDVQPANRPEPSPGSGNLPFGESRLEEARRAILERRSHKWRASLKRLALFVAGPILAILLYVSLFAIPLYEGEAVFTVQTSANSAASPSAGIFSVTSANSTIADAFKARAFILSRPMMEHMQKRYGFLDHFAGQNMDPLSRFDGPFGLNQDPFRYYQKRVAVSVDVQEGILRLHVEARTPEDAIRFGNGILGGGGAPCERFVRQDRRRPDRRADP